MIFNLNIYNTFCCFILSFIPYPAPPPTSLQYVFDSAIFYIFEIFYIYLGYFIFIWDILYLFGIFYIYLEYLILFGIFYIYLGYFINIWDILYLIGIFYIYLGWLLKGLEYKYYMTLQIKIAMPN